MNKPSPSESASPLQDESRPGATPVDSTAPGEGYVIPVVPPPWLGWAVATCFLFAAIFFAAKSFNVRGELQSILDSERITRLEVGTLKNLLEAERILSRGQLNHLAASEQLIADLRAQTDLARLKIVALASSSTDARAVVVWSPAQQEGVLVTSTLSASPADKDYQLWLIDDQNRSMSGGVITVDTDTDETRVHFKPSENIAAVRKFIVSVERKGGVSTAEGTQILVGEIK